MEYTLQLATLAELHGFAAGLAALIRKGDVIALSGPIGAGKTTLVRELVRLLTGSDAASSPSFVIWQQYEGLVPVHHLDLYRLEDQRELAELGLHEAFSDDACTIVEWPQRASALTAHARLRVEIEGAGDEPRRLKVTRRA